MKELIETPVFRTATRPSRLPQHIETPVLRTATRPSRRPCLWRRSEPLAQVRASTTPVSSTEQCHLEILGLLEPILSTHADVGRV